MEKEIWKDIKGYEGFYQISNHGRVKSLKRKVYAGRNRMRWQSAGYKWKYADEGLQNQKVNDII